MDKASVTPAAAAAAQKRKTPKTADRCKTVSSFSSLEEKL